MRKLLSAYMAHKKITIPVTIVAAALLVSGITFGVIESSKKVDTPSVSASKDAEKKEDVASKKKAEKKETASKDDKKESDIKELPEAKDNTKDTKQTTTAKNDTKKSDTSTASEPAATTPASNAASNQPASGGGYGIMPCPLCNQQIPRGNYLTNHDCPNTKDAYGNIVPKNSRYVVAVGGFGTKKYSDGTYEVTEEGRNACRQGYESELELQGGPVYPHLQSLDAFVISCSGI